jgi:hypothetical protein
MNVKDLLEIPPWEWPRNAGDIFLKLLVDKQADGTDRLFAAELAGELVVMNDRIANALLALVSGSDEPEDLRATAAIGLGPVLEQADTELLDNDQFDDPEAVPITLLTFRNLQGVLRNLYFDEGNPKEVRRRILEAAVRSQQDWQPGAIRDAYSSGDSDWKLTAVFAMRWIRGFDEQILEAIESTDPELHFEAVVAAGNWQLEAAWPHVLALVKSPTTPQPLLLAAIGAVGSIHPQEAREVLGDLTLSDDQEIAEAASEALSMANAMLSEPDDEEADNKEWIN